MKALKSKRVVFADGIRPATVVMAKGKIADCLPYEAVVPVAKLFDVGHDAVLPGLVDPHVHINEPGRTDWEGFATATQAAVAGGVTTLVDMPLNCSPVTTTLAALELKKQSVAGQLFCDVGLWGGLVPENVAPMAEFISSSVMGVKCFLSYSGLAEFPQVKEQDLRLAMPIIASTGKPLLVHAELESCVTPAPDQVSPYRAFVASRPESFEIDAIRMMIRLAKEFQTRVHIVHLSSAKALPILEQAKNDGIAITVETCPHYLCLQEEKIPPADASFKCMPPIRDALNCEKLWDGLARGVIDFVCSDHSPCLPSMKFDGDFASAWGGISSLQLSLSVLWRHAKERGHSLNDVCRWLSTAPAAFLGLAGRKGSIVRGADADLFVFASDLDYRLEKADLFYKNKFGPYLGQVLLGKVKATFLRSELVFDQGTFAPPVGRLLG